MKKMQFVTGMIVALAIGIAGVPAFGMDNVKPEHCKETKGNVASQEQTSNAHQGHGGTGEKLQWEGMSKHMIPMMKTLSGMTQNLAEAMATGMDDNKMGTLAGLMDEVSTHMLRMFDMMNNRSATEGEMHTLQIGINGTEARINQQITMMGKAVKAVNVGNKYCPVNGALIDEKTKVTYEYKGKIYNFLSQMCVESFKKDPEKYIAGLDKPAESKGHEGHKMQHNHGQ